MSSPQVKPKITYNDLGLVTAIDFIKVGEPEAKHFDSTDEFLAHYGVPGMKWGKRKAGSSKVAPSEDHIRVESLRDRKKSSGTKSLSNKELQEVITRKNLEKQYKDLSPTTIQRGEKMAGKALSKVGDRLAADAVKKGAALAGGAVLTAVAGAALKGI